MIRAYSFSPKKKRKKGVTHPVMGLTLENVRGERGRPAIALPSQSEKNYLT